MPGGKPLTGEMEQTPHKKIGSFRGYLCIAIATLFWGISATLGRAVFTGRLGAGKPLQPIEPLILAQSRTSLSLILLVPILLIARRGGSGLRMPRRDLGTCLVLGVLGMAASNYFYYLAIQKTSVATAIILQYTAPVWVLLYMVLRKLQRATTQRIVSVLLAVLGSALAIGLLSPGTITMNTVGIVAAQLAAVSFAFYNVVGGQVLQRYDRWRVLFWVLVGAAAFWQLINPVWKIAQAHYTSEQWSFMALFAITSILIPFSFYFLGLQYLDATQAIVTSCLEPVFSILIAASFLGELLGPVQIAGIAIVLISTVLVQMPNRKREEPAVVIEPIE
jgi:drug/metabolite transporter (DMT)-like permease